MPMEGRLKEVAASAAKHPRKNELVINYGTAGFRTRATDLDHVIYRMGLLAALRSRCLNGATVGVVITASHNPEEDNGVKLVDPLGEMLHVTWETLATRLANVSDAHLVDEVKKISQLENIDDVCLANVVFARDTRPSSLSLARALQDGIEAMQATFTDYGVLATPQLHYMVRCLNSNAAYGEPTEEGYYTKLSRAFKRMRACVECVEGRYQPQLFIDGANGVGALKMAELDKFLDRQLEVTIVNDGSSGKLNHMCGADYVKVQQEAPKGFRCDSDMKCVSFDGDGDRIVYYYKSGDGVFHLLDGDKIATLIAGFLKELVSQTGLELNLGIVQTAYANGSSTNYITQKLDVPVACVATGVKHLHHRAKDFDIGVYFEANGHGTVLFSDSSLTKLKNAQSSSCLSDDQKEAAANPLSDDQKAAAMKLAAVVDMINQTVGDALSDLLLVETVLWARGWSFDDWNKTYTDLPNRQLKVKVKDRTVIQTTDAERRAKSPAGLQTAIDDLVAKFKHGRSFVRPSGTEDVVRVYAEAATQAAAESLAYEVSQLVYRLAGGQGPAPQPPS